MIVLTESQESDEDTDELHCSSSGGGGGVVVVVGLVVEGKEGELDSRVGRVESGEEIAEHRLCLNIIRWSLRPQTKSPNESGNKVSA